MSFAINQNFDLKSRVKDFTRQELKLTDLPNTRDADYPDDYLIAIDGKLYIFNSSNSSDSTTGKWREFKSGLQSISQATSSTYGGIKIGFPESSEDRNYPVELNGTGQAYVNVPWTDANTTYGIASSSSNGLMSSDMFNKLNGIEAGATKITVDNALSNTSQNPVQNNVINSALNGKAATNHKHTASDITSGLATVATSGSYNDLSNKPTIPSAYTLPAATSSKLGGIKVGSGLSVTADGTLSAIGGGGGVTYEQATSTTLGLVKIGATGLGTKQYAVQLNSSGQMFVAVPWTDTNTTYTTATTSSNGLMSSTDKNKLDKIKITNVTASSENTSGTKIGSINVDNGTSVQQYNLFMPDGFEADTAITDEQINDICV